MISFNKSSSSTAVGPGCQPNIACKLSGDGYVRPVTEFAEGEVSAGTPIGANDLLVAAHALSADLAVVTANTREFSRVPDLKVENWLER